MPPTLDLATVADRLDDELRTDDYADVDASANGLQVGPDAGTVETVALAVDAAAATIEEAASVDADLMVAHHGLVWGGLDRVTGREYDLVSRLVEDDLALYVSHLPLDGHERLGNAAGLADLLDLADRERFGALGPEYVGLRGRAAVPLGVEDLAVTLDRELDTGTRGVQVLDFGPDRVEDVAIVTGSGVDWLDEAVAAGADALVTGEGKQQVYHAAREAGINVFLAGHYATETFGVRAVGERLETWGLETQFVDHPTGI